MGQLAWMVLSLATLALIVWFVVLCLLRPARVASVVSRLSPRSSLTDRMAGVFWRLPLYRWLAPGETYQSYREKARHHPEELPRLLLLLRLTAGAMILEVVLMMVAFVVLTLAR